MKLGYCTFVTLIKAVKLQMNTNFQIHTDLSRLPANEHEAYLEEGFSGVCTGGTAVIQLFSVRRRISKNDLVTILPLQLVSICEVSSDFSMTFFKVGKAMFLDIMCGLGKLTPDFFFFMRKNFHTHLSADETKRFLGYCRVVGFRGSSDDPAFRHETVLHLLRIYYWDHYVAFQKKTDKRNNPFLNSNKEKIAFRFAMLVSEHYSTHRQVAFYADKLCITPAYLTQVIQEVNGQGAREMIADYVVVGIKSMLRDANLDIKDVTRKTGFASQSSFSRFFRQQTGMSPSEYRRTIHVSR